MKKLCVALLAAPSMAMAGTAGMAIHSSSDTDGMGARYIISSASAQLLDELSVGYSYTDLYFSSGEWKQTGHRHAIQATADVDAWKVTADLGVTSTTEDTGTGSIQAEYSFGSNMVYVGVERNLVDNQTGIQNNLTFDNYFVGTDLVFGDVGVAASIGTTRYSDNNNRSFNKVKGYYVVADGVHVYARNLYYSNSSPYTGNYFSPDSYYQTLAGVGVRYRVGPGVMVAHADAGQQTVDGTGEFSYTWRVAYNVERTEGWSVTAYAGQDQKQPEYRYNEIGIAVIMRF